MTQHYRRNNIIIIFNLNCVFQFINQSFRIKYNTFELSNEGIAILSFACGAIGPLYKWKVEQRVRREGKKFRMPNLEFDHTFFLNVLNEARNGGRERERGKKVGVQRESYIFFFPLRKNDK